MSLDQPSYDSRSAYPPYGFSCLPYVEGPGVTRVRLSGELDITTAPQLDDALSEAARGSVAVILDLSELTFMESSGLHAIITARSHLAQADCRLALVMAAGRYN